MNINNMLDTIKEIYMHFSDELSQQLYIDRLNWLVTGDNRYVDSIVRKSHPEMPIWNRREEQEFLSELSYDKKLILYGAGSFSKRLLPYLQGYEGGFVFCDADEGKQRDGYEGYSVISPEELCKIEQEKQIIICTTKYMNEVRSFLLKHGIGSEEIIDIRPYFKCGTGDDYFYEDFLQFSEDEIFVDAGCYDLSTSMDFKKICKNLKKIYAFEPDKDNYRNCRDRIEQESLTYVEMFPYGTWSGKTELHFSATADGCSHIGEGDTSIRTISIDEVVEPEDKITFIKMDVEGAELESLKGAKTIITRYKPKLAICIYHKPEDIVTLPEYILSLVPEYKLYLRSYSNADNEMVLYAVL